MDSLTNDKNSALPTARRFNLARAVGLWILALLLGAVGMFLLQKYATQPVASTSIKPPIFTIVSTKETIRNTTYTPPENRNEALQAFDRALLYLVTKQETDGHWSAEHSGAEKEFCNPNGDITLTALGTYALMSGIIGTQPNPSLIESSRRSLRWLRERLRDDGGIADERGPGEPVVAQIFSTLVLLQAASMSPQEIYEKQATSAARHCILKMTNPEGGFNTRLEASDSRLDLTALGAYLNMNALSSKVRFSSSKEDLDKFTVELKIEKGFQSILNKTRIAPDKRDGVFRMNSSGGEVDFDATLCGMLAQVLANLPPREVTPGITFILGTTTGTGQFPNAGYHLNWGKNGEGYRALPTWLGSLAFAFYGDTESGLKVWTQAFNDTVLPHQSKDGSWEAAGQDARYGRLWRTTLTAFSLVLLNPTPAVPPSPAR